MSHFPPLFHASYCSISLALHLSVFLQEQDFSTRMVGRAGAWRAQTTSCICPNFPCFSLKLFSVSRYHDTNHACEMSSRWRAGILPGVWLIVKGWRRISEKEDREPGKSKEEPH
ncbi:hypothetical protein ABW19_dt0207585 [Dactylella cylindrospora]|nr:hypothetical protein ABW19_dt0207585 [Dactylella cylindrospora]